MKKLEKGQEITINVPFTYTIGEKGNFTEKELNSIEDCKAEVIAEIEAGLNATELFFSVEQSELEEAKAECIRQGLHLTDCDNDGYCNHCGYQ